MVLTLQMDKASFLPALLSFLCSSSPTNFNLSCSSLFPPFLPPVLSPTFYLSLPTLFAWPFLLYSSSFSISFLPPLSKLSFFLHISFASFLFQYFCICSLSFCPPSLLSLLFYLNTHSLSYILNFFPSCYYSIYLSLSLIFLLPTILLPSSPLSFTSSPSLSAQ